MKKLRVLFICTYQGARSRMAEMFANQAALGQIEAYSSSFESGKIGPLPIAVMKTKLDKAWAHMPKNAGEKHTLSKSIKPASCYQATMTTIVLMAL